MGIETLDAENAISKEVVQQFRDADGWLKPLAKLPN